MIYARDCLELSLLTEPKHSPMARACPASLRLKPFLVLPTAGFTRFEGAMLNNLVFEQNLRIARCLVSAGHWSLCREP
jgi:hypothetical protein